MRIGYIPQTTPFTSASSALLNLFPQYRLINAVEPHEAVPPIISTKSFEQNVPVLASAASFETPNEGVSEQTEYSMQEYPASFRMQIL